MNDNIIILIGWLIKVYVGKNSTKNSLTLLTSRSVWDNFCCKRTITVAGLRLPAVETSERVCLDSTYSRYRSHREAFQSWGDKKFGTVFLTVEYRVKRILDRHLHGTSVKPSSFFPPPFFNLPQFRNTNRFLGKSWTDMCSKYFKTWKDRVEFPFMSHSFPIYF